jgi:hypothetical protein
MKLDHDAAAAGSSLETGGGLVLGIVPVGTKLQFNDFIAELFCEPNGTIPTPTHLALFPVVYRYVPYAHQ